MNLREFLALKDKYPDDHKVTLADGVEATLGDLRAYAAEQESQVSAKLAELSQREASLGNMANELAELRARLDQAAQDPVQAAIDPRLNDLLDMVGRAKNGNRVSIFDEPGDYFKPLIEKLAKYEADIKAQEAAIQAQRADVEKTLSWHIQKQVQRDYRSYSDWPEGFDVNKAVVTARQNRLVDEMGYPDFDRLHDAVTAPARQKQALEAERARIRQEEREAIAKEQQQRQRDAFVPMPNGGGGAALGGKRYGGIEKISDADVLSDPDILSTFNGIQN